MYFNNKIKKILLCALIGIYVISNISLSSNTTMVFADKTEQSSQDENSVHDNQNDAALQTASGENNQQKSQVWPVGPEIFAEAGILIEASTGTVLYDKNAHERHYPASITKILTSLIAFEEGNLEDMVNYYHYDIYSLESGAAHVSMKENEQLSLLDSLYAVMLASANECSNAVAEYIARKQPAFTEKINQLKAGNQEYSESKVALEVFSDMMNERAKKAGALDSHFVNPNGLFLEDHYTTCYDMAMITRETIKLDQFLKLESNTSHVLPVTNLTPETRAIANRHKMLFASRPEYYEGILGGKTGYVDQSGNTLVTFARRNGMTLISVVMKTNADNVYNDTRLLLDYGFNNFTLTDIQENENKFTFSNNNFLSSSSSMFSTEMPLLSIEKSKNVVLPINATINDCSSNLVFDDSTTDSSVFATINYSYAGINVGSANLLLNSNDNAFEFNPKKDETEKSENNDEKSFITINIWIVLAIIAVIALLLVLILYLKSTREYRVRRRKNRRRNRARKKRIRR